jgi:hypothetical protein
MVRPVKQEREAFDYLMQVKAPRSFAEALTKAAADRMVSRSDYIRTTLADRLKADGVEAGAA